MLLFRRMIKLIKKLLSLEIIRFIIGGGINTLMGGMLLPYIFEVIFGEIELFTFLGVTTYVGLLVGYLIWFTFAYFIQIKFVFNTSFDVKRFIIYPFTQIPNFLINSLFLYLFRNILSLPGFVSYVLAAIATVPIMFVLVRLVVKKGKKHEE